MYKDPEVRETIIGYMAKFSCPNFPGILLIRLDGKYSGSGPKSWWWGAITYHLPEDLVACHHLADL